MRYLVLLALCLSSYMAFGLTTTRYIETLSTEEFINNGAEIHSEVRGEFLLFRINLDKLKLCKADKLYVNFINSLSDAVAVVPVAKVDNEYEFRVKESALNKISVFLWCSGGQFALYELMLDPKK